MLGRRWGLSFREGIRTGLSVYGEGCDGVGIRLCWDLLGLGFSGVGLRREHGPIILGLDRGLSNLYLSGAMLEKENTSFFYGEGAREQVIFPGWSWFRDRLLSS